MKNKKQKKAKTVTKLVKKELEGVSGGLKEAGSGEVEVTRRVVRRKQVTRRRSTRIL